MIQVRNLTVEFSQPDGSRVRAVDGVSLDIREGELVGLIGPNGCGKSTLVRCLNGLVRPTAGRVLVDGLDTEDPRHLIEIRRRVGMVFQNPDNQMVATSVEREIAFGLENLGVPREEMHRRVEEALDRFDLRAYRHQPPHLLSGGEKQRLAIASVVALRPRYLILDEPTSVLDPPGRAQVLKLVRELVEEDPQRAIVFITQFPEEVESFPRLLVMHQGRVVLDGEPKGIFARVDMLLRIGLEPPVEYLAEQIWAATPWGAREKDAGTRTSEANGESRSTAAGHS
ncbi:MAG: ATP-binding cassette domain-containing protein [candidate division KSB1 bacterium]|nr:ATP-binding cassette domain-containing protein [candidate division KSB1 bacterium]